MLILITLLVWCTATLSMMLWLQQRRLAIWRKAKGVVVGLSGPNSHGYAAIVEFTTDRGVKRTLFDRWRSEPSRYCVGERVNVAYDPATPSRAVIISFGGIYFIRYAAASIATTLPFLVLAIYLQT